MSQLRPLHRRYLETRGRIVSLVRDAGDDTARATRVPACEEWTVHDVLAHVAGIPADVLAGRMDGMTTEGWTAAQVDARRDASVDEIAAEWETSAGEFAAMVDDFPGWYGVQVCADLAVHEQDLRGALRKPGFRDSPAVLHALDLLLCAVVHPAASARGLGPMEVVAGDRSWLLGGDTSAYPDPQTAIDTALLSGQRPAASSAPGVITVKEEPFEVFRAVTGRRSAAQISRFGWSGDPAAYLPLFGQGPFRLRDTDLDE